MATRSDLNGVTKRDLEELWQEMRDDVDRRLDLFRREMNSDLRALFNDYAENMASSVRKVVSKGPPKCAGKACAPCRDEILRGLTRGSIEVDEIRSFAYRW